MKCPKCQSDMAQSKVGWLCPDCGHLEGIASAATAKIDAKAKPPKTVKTKPPVTASPVATSSNPPSPVTPPPPVSPATQPASKSTASPLPSVAGSAPRPKTQRTRRLPIVVAAIILLLIIGFGYTMAAYKPYYHFERKIEAAKTLSYDGMLTFAADGFLASFGSDITFNGQYVATSTNGPSANLNFEGTWASQQYDGQAVLKDGTLFFKLAGPVLPVIRYNQSSFLYPVTNDWHQTKIDNSLYGNYCETRPDSRYPEGLEIYRLIRGLKTKNSPWVNLFARQDGQPATQYSGSVDPAQMPGLLNQINALLPESCGLQNYSFPNDPKQLSIKYTLTTSQSSDRFTLNFDDKSVGAKVNFTINLTGYNQPVSITPPPVAIDLATVRQQQLDLLVRDQTRRADLDKLKTALTSYAAANKKLFPSNINSLVPKYLSTLPIDPKTKQPYNYATAPGRKGYTLAATLEEPNAGVYTLTGP